jgi:hypothetical protein
MLSIRARRLVSLLAALAALVLTGCLGLLATPAAHASGAQNRVGAFTPDAPTPHRARSLRKWLLATGDRMCHGRRPKLGIASR